MFPIKDENPTETKSYITVILIVINIFVYFYQASLTGDENYNLILQYGFKPADFFSLDSNEYYFLQFGPVCLCMVVYSIF